MKLSALVIALLAVASPLVAVEPGQKAPDFALKDQRGNTVELSDSEGSIRVLEWTNPECPFVVRHYKAGTMKQLAATYGDKGVVWLTINSSHHQDAEVNRAFATEYELDQTILTDQSGDVGRAYGARTTPHMFIIDEEGTVVYAGGIDDDPRGRSDAPTNYVDQALTALLAGENVEPSATDPYGCSVKYAKK